ncbi:MAG: DUF58 domain-containing protein [Oscillospiraceae bacterium]|nr:DUF58 domain-containing protein [Oscillospiraceae bacterium]
MKILYIIMLIAAAVFYPLFKDDLSFILLVTLLAIPFVLGIMLIATAKRIKIRVGEKSFRGVRGEAVTVELTVKNPTPLPVSSLRINLRYGMDGTKEQGKYTVSLPLKALSEEKIAVNLKAEHCGILRFKIDKVYASDLIGLFKMRIKTDISGEALLFPKELPCYPSFEEIPAQRDDCGRIYAGRGNDPSEIAALREYVDGDRMNRIHWKLSSRSSELIVKELSDDYSGRILLIPDIDACRSGGEHDSVLDVFFSFGRFLLSNTGELASLSLKDELCVEKIDSGDGLESMIWSLLESISGAKRDISMTAAFSEECAAYAGDRFAHIIIITPRERQAILSEIEHSCCAERISVLCTGEKGSVDESKSSDVIVYFMGNKGRLEIPSNFII